jgi:hypothetical protein
MADLKAVSQNLMHGNVGVTDGIYAILSDQDRRERIRGLGSEQGDGGETSASSVESLGDVIGQLEMLLARLKAKS